VSTRRNLIAILAVLTVVAFLSGCETPAPPQPKPQWGPGQWKIGQAMWYGQMYNGLRTTSGELFDMNKLTAAHAKLPYGTKVEVKNPRNGKTVTVVINDRSHLSEQTELAISKAAAAALDLVYYRHFAVEYRWLP